MRRLALADVWVVVDNQTVARNKTDADGRFVMARVPHGNGRVFAAAPGQTTGLAYARLDESRPAASVDIRLFDAVVLSGTVTGTDGKPVAGAQVMAPTTAYGYFATPSGTTDAAGRFRFADVALGDTMFCVFAPGYRLLEERLDLRSDRALDLRLEQGPGTTLRFRVTGASKEQLASARCSFMAVRGRGADDVLLPPAVREGTPGPDGVWQAEGLPRDLRYMFASVQIADATVTPSRRDAAAEQELHELEFAVVAAATLQLRGVLVDGSGKPVPGCALRCQGRGLFGTRITTAITGTDGSFTIVSPAPKGDLFVLAAADRGLCLHQEKTDQREVLYNESEFVGTCAPDEVQRVVAVPAAELRGRVLDPAGQPVFGAWVKLLMGMKEVLPAFGSFEIVPTDRQGRFTIRQLNGRLERSLYLAVASPAGTLFLSELKLPAKGALDLGDLQLIAPAEVTGIVTDENDKPVPGARVRLCEQQASATMRDFVVAEMTIADRAGRYRFTGLAPGRYRLDPIAGQGEPKQRGPQFELEAGKKHDEPLRLAK